MYALARNSKSFPIIIQQAKGSWLWDQTGKKYLDAFSSFSSVNFGHRHPTLYRSFIEQSQQLSVFSRTFPSDILLKFCDLSHKLFSPHIKTNELKVIPMNSGVEAGETAVKLVRKWGYLHKNIPIGQAKIVFANGNYWGRTVSAISTSDYAYQQFFSPFTDGFLKVPYNDSQSLEELLKKDKTITAVFLEPIQGEGGINIPSSTYFKTVRELCDKYNVLLICDEIQTGMGRVGTSLCIEQYGIQADVILLGKSLGGGFVPFSVCMARRDVADVLLSEHSSTFGGFPLGCRMGYESLLLHTTLLSTVKKREREFRIRLADLQKRFPHIIQGVRGKGMLWGIVISPLLQPFDVAIHLLKYGVVTREANTNVLRICPPLTSTDIELEYMFDALELCFKTL